ncbi:TIGR03118 family protein [Bradyrhizobium sp. Rc2d]|uniref:TIGR03118 family protein n=1 Tax=Bradyrhizobium sp. Rc2d TaxID=1855321 RepID=UPI0015A12FD3|nr:TIGR03118 family protein [Bradyrhizobium sp. Rc2d]
MKAPFQSDPTPADAADAAIYVQTNLVSDIPGLAAVTDPNLVNPWGVSFLPGSPFWISDQHTNLATVYPVTDSTDVSPAVLTVSIPTTATGPQGPTGQVSNTNASSFILDDDASARFIFADLNGTISGWNPGLGTTASVEVTTPAPSIPDWQSTRLTRCSTPPTPAPGPSTSSTVASTRST